MRPDAHTLSGGVVQPDRLCDRRGQQMHLIAFSGVVLGVYEGRESLPAAVED
jgi:hypothetical protein